MPLNREKQRPQAGVTQGRLILLPLWVANFLFGDTQVMVASLCTDRVKVNTSSLRWDTSEKAASFPG